MTGILRCDCGCTRDMYGKYRAGKKRYQCDGCGGWVVESKVLEGIALAIKKSLSPTSMKRLRTELERQTAVSDEQPSIDGSIEELQQQLAKQERKLVVLDADLLGPVQAEIRRIQSQINVLKARSRLPGRTNQLGLVDRALDCLKRLPALFKDLKQTGQERSVKAKLPDLVDHVRVRPEAKGVGKGKRWRLASGQVVLNTAPGAREVEPALSWMSTRRLRP